MKENVKQRQSYQSPTLVDYGDIRKLTAAATGIPGQMDSMYFMGYMNNLNYDPNHTFS